MELTILLTKTEGFDINELNRDDIDKIRITYPEYYTKYLVYRHLLNILISGTHQPNLKIAQSRTRYYKCSTDTRYQQVFVNLVSF